MPSKLVGKLPRNDVGLRRYLLGLLETLNKFVPMGASNFQHQLIATVDGVTCSGVLEVIATRKKLGYIASN